MMKIGTADEAFDLALKAAERAGQNNEVPIGAAIVKDGQILAVASNETERRETFTAHAEMLAIEMACKKLKSKYLIDAELYVTLEPCHMCLTAAKLARPRRIHYLARSEKFGRNGPGYSKIILSKSRKKTLTQMAVSLLQAFFSARRYTKEK